MRRILSALTLLLAAGCVPRPVDVTDLQRNTDQPVPVPGIPAATARATAVLNGTVRADGPFVLPEGAVVTVRVEDVSRADAPSTVVAEQQIRPGAQTPVVFGLAYTPAEIDVRRRYTVRATIRDAAGALLWTTTTHTPVFTQGGPVDGVEVVVERIGSGG